MDTNKTTALHAADPPACCNGDCSQGDRCPLNAPRWGVDTDGQPIDRITRAELLMYAVIGASVIAASALVPGRWF